MLDRFISAWERLVSGQPPQRTLVGYSGGADSTCLIHLMHRAGIPLVAGHLNHSQRPEADEEQERCAAFCQELNVDFAVGRADVPLIAGDLKIGLEEAGRRARYTFFERAAAQTGCDAIVTAHTLDDHVETILMNVARGSGLNGLTGIPERRDGILRPLRSIRREETRAYCQEHGLWFHDDPANSDEEFTRARVRLRIVPEFEALNPGFAEAVSRLSDTVAMEDRFLDGMAAAALEQSEHPLNGPLAFLTKDVELAFSRARLKTLPVVLVRRGLRMAISALGAQLDHRQTTLAVEGIGGSEPGSITPEGGQAVLEWNGDVVHLRALVPTEPYRHTLTVPGETISDEFGWRLLAHADATGNYLREPRSLDVVIDSGQTTGPLYFRSVQDGDSLQPLGMTGTRKVGEMMGEAGLTLAARRRLPIVCDMAGPIWVPGVAIADRVKMKLEGSTGLRLALEPIS